MPKVDQFESVFRAATKERFRFEQVKIESVLIVTDLGEGEAAAFEASVQKFLRALGNPDAVRWKTLRATDFTTAKDLDEIVEAEKPDLICSYRNLHSSAWEYPYSLGKHLDVLTQVAPMPVLVLPHPKAGRASDHAMQDTKIVMAVTDHLTGDGHLVSYAATFTEPGGDLWLTHIEDDATFERYLDAISKIPSIDTDLARAELGKRLLKDPSDYIVTCEEGLRAAGHSLHIKKIVQFGHHLTDYKRAIEDHKIDLLVMNTKDEDQFAMHGLAYALAVELRQIPLLML